MTDKIELIFATGNQHKVDEICSLLSEKYALFSLKDIKFEEELPETQETIEGNSLQKAETLYRKINKNCFSEDTGLEIEALNGRPGVRSARYAGDSEQNIEKVLAEMANQQNRTAQFKTVITYFFDKKYVQYTGICKGQIIHSKIGENGFGYDPIFIPDGSDKTFAEMTMTEKNKFSHRKKAVAQFISFLENNH